MKRIGIFSGTFDPVHIGHIEACLVSRAACELDEVLLMIEKTPKRKKDVTGYKHRKAMVELAVKDFTSINLEQTSEENITFEKTGKQLESKHKGATLVMIMGSDMLDHLQDWPGLEDWLANHELCVVLRENKDKAAANKSLDALHTKYANLKASVVPAVWSPVSSASIKQTIKKEGGSEQIHRDVMDYIRSHKLYGFSDSK